MRVFRCPDCEDEITYVKYSHELNEYGRYELPSVEEALENSSEIYEGEHQCHDTDYNGSFTYRCPQCDCQIALSELQEALEESNDDEDDKDEEEIEEPEEKDCTSRNIKVEQKYISLSRGGKGNAYSCPNCLHETITNQMELLEECPNCGAKNINN